MLSRLNQKPKFIVFALAAYCWAGFAAPAAYSAPVPGEIVTTRTLIEDRRGVDVKAGLRDALDRADVVNLLEANGVSPAEAQARVAALTDAEARMLATKFEELPAGGDVTLLLVIIILILLLR